MNKQITTSPSSGTDPNQRRNTTSCPKAKDKSNRPVKKRTKRGKVRVYRGCIDVWAPISWAAASTGKPRTGWSRDATEYRALETKVGRTTLRTPAL